MNRYLSILLVCSSLSANAQGVIFTIGGTGTSGHSGDGGQAVSANIALPVKGRLDNIGNYYFAEWDSNRVRKIDPNGIITTIAGTGVPGFNGNNIAATSATLSKPADVIADSVGNLFIADQYNFRVRRIDAATGIITTIAGNGQSTSTGDGGPAANATIQWPVALAFSKQGELYICSNSKIRKIDNAGIITTFLQGAAPIKAVSFDSSGNMYYIEGLYVKMLDSTGGGPYTLGGVGNAAFSGDGGLAVDAGMDPVDLAVDHYRNIFVADKMNGRIRWIDSLGNISTVVGGGSWLGDWGPATNANIQPGGVTTDTCGNIYIADGNFRIRKVTYPACHYLVVSVSDITPLSFSISPNPATSLIAVSSNKKIKEITLLNTMGQAVLHRDCNATSAGLNVEQLQAGVYFIRVSDSMGGVRVEKIIKE